MCLYWKWQIFLLYTWTFGWCVCIGNDESSSCSPGPGLVCLCWKWRIFLLFTWTWDSVFALEITNLPLVHLDLGWCVCIGNDESLSNSTGSGLVCLYWKFTIILLFTCTWACVSILEMTNLPLVHLDLGWCVCIGNDESSSCSPGPGLMCLYWEIYESASCSPGPGLVCLYWK